MTVHVYVDVDGVLNAVNTDTPPWGWPDAKQIHVNRIPVLYSPSLVAEFNRLTALPGVRFFWLTTWNDTAATELAPAIGLTGAWDVMGRDWFHREDGNHDWWKYRAIVDHTARTNPDAVIWLDDDIADDPLATDWITDHTDAGTPVLAVSPDYTTGLTRDHMRDVATFITTHTG